MITQTTIEKIRDIDIHRIAEKYSTGPVKKQGANHIMKCCFHNDNKPSLVLNSKHNYCKCFACGESADNIGLVMQLQGLSFPDATKRIALDFGIEVKEQGKQLSEADKKQLRETENMSIVNQWAADWYHRQLITRLEDIEPAKFHFKVNVQATEEKDKAESLEYAELQYIRERFSDEEIKSHHLGYAPKGWDNLTQAALKGEIKREILLSAGVSKIRTSGHSEHLNDNFVFRPLILPIWNKRGRVVGFSARKMPWTKDDYPKYQNTSDTELFKKGEILYGLNDRTRQKIRETNRIYLVEGYTDQISMFTAGFENTISLNGTAMTDEQADLIKKLADYAVMLYDGDKAGRAATERNGVKLLERGMNITVLPLPDGDDPDTYLKDGNDLKKLEEDTEQEYILYMAEQLFSKATNKQEKDKAKELTAELLIYLPKPAQVSYLDKLPAISNESRKNWQRHLHQAAIRVRNKGLTIEGGEELKPDNSAHNKRMHGFYDVKKDAKGKFKALAIDQRKLNNMLQKTNPLKNKVGEKETAHYFGFFVFANTEDLEDWNYVQLKEGRIKKVSNAYIRNAFQKFVQTLPPVEYTGYDNEGMEWSRIITAHDLESVFLEKIETLFNDKRLALFPNKNIEILKDTLFEHYTFFNNCWVVTNKDGLTVRDYSELKGGFVWEDSVINRDFKIPDNKISVFEKFVQDISGNEYDNENNQSIIKDRERLQAVEVAGGYMLHNFMDRKRKAVFFNQGRISEDTSEGREGKTLFVKGIGDNMMNRGDESRTFVYIAGKDFQRDNKHKWQRIDRQTTTVLLDDPAWLNFEDFYNVSENAFPVSHMYGSEFNVKALLLVTLNRAIDRDSGSSRDRSCIIELDSIYSASYSPIDKYGHYFFRDWDKAEWNRFSHYVLLMSVKYFKNKAQLIEPKSKNLHRNELLQMGKKYTGSMEVVFWMDILAQGTQAEEPYFKEGEWYWSRDLRKKLVEDVELYKSSKNEAKLNNNFVKVVTAYFEKENIAYKKDRDGRGVKWLVEANLPKPHTISIKTVEEYFLLVPEMLRDIDTPDKLAEMTKDFNKENTTILTTEEFHKLAKQVQEGGMPF